MDEILRSLAFRITTDPVFFSLYLFLLGTVALELLRRNIPPSQKQLRRVALVLYPFLVVTVAGLFLVLDPPSAYDTSRDEIEHIFEADFGEQVALIGYDIADRTVELSGTVQLTLYWQSLGNIPVDYSAFVHLLSADGTMVTQGDRLAGDANPTSYWFPGEVVPDWYQLALPADLAVGRCEIVIGLYQWQTGERLPVYVNGTRIPNDALTLPETIYVFDH